MVCASFRVFPDDRLLATTSADATTRLWETASGRFLGALRGQTIGVSGACFSPDGRTLATTGGDRTLTLWHVASRQEMLTLHWEGTFPAEPWFSPDGDALGVGAPMFYNVSGAVQIWRAPSLRQIERVKGMDVGLVQRR